MRTSAKSEVEAAGVKRPRMGPRTPEGLERLRQSAFTNRPWERSTGPRSATGKMRSSLNSIVHGKETAARRRFRRDAFRLIRAMRLFREAVRAGWVPPDLLEEMDRLERALS